MLNKYIHAMVPIYEFIKNHVELGMHPHSIAELCVNKFRLEVRLYKLPADMLIEIYNSIAEAMWFQRYGNHEYITKDKESLCHKE